ncbi:hypothetical protein AB0N14_39385 [Streptomyces sp. NPDC051104]|uniref:hypothetical protein n=1 Tax=Streptomyces sp. NPDC051104 TaxID=3155044 RepID=UPI00342EFB78
MTGFEIVVGYLCAWGVRKARRVGERADGEVDRALDAGLDRLQDLVRQKLGEDTALHRLTEEAASGQGAPSNRTRQRVQLALEDAAEHDAAFAADLEQAVQHLRGIDRAAADHIEFQHNTFHGPVQVKGVQHNHPGTTW